MIQRGLMIVYLKIDSPRVKKTNEDEFDPKLSKLFYWRGVDLKGRSICKFLWLLLIYHNCSHRASSMERFSHNRGQQIGLGKSFRGSLVLPKPLPFLLFSWRFIRLSVTQVWAVLWRILLTSPILSIFLCNEGIFLHLFLLSIAIIGNSIKNEKFSIEINKATIKRRIEIFSYRNEISKFES